MKAKIILAVIGGGGGTQNRSSIGKQPKTTMLFGDILHFRIAQEHLCFENNDRAARYSWSGLLPKMCLFHNSFAELLFFGLK